MATKEIGQHYFIQKSSPLTSKAPGLNNRIKNILKTDLREPK